MLEDYCTMEKKPNGRSVQPPLKGGGTELKKSVDSTSTKPFGKFSRRREPAAYSNSKNEANRKPNPFKSAKCFDKRPRTRSQYFGSGKTDTKVAAEEDPEYGSLYSTGSKKQNLNHLLNFHYTPRASPARSSGSLGHSVASAKWLTTYKHKYNKEHFLQANCQFVVKADEDYSQHFADPDLLVKWDAIEQIRLQSGALVSCPICLDTPTAAKMTRCGHVYCWPCMLHYLALSDEPWRKCPICYVAVYKNDLKSVVTMAHVQFNVGEEITFKLMKRERGSLLPVPVEQCELREAVGSPILSVTEKNIDTVYSKLLLAKPHEVMSIIERERSELKGQLIENEGCPELCFIEQALDILNEREERLMNTLSTSNSPESGDCQMQKLENIPSSENEMLSSSPSDELCSGFHTSLNMVDSFDGALGEPVKNNESDSSDDDQPNIKVEDLEISQSHHNGVPRPFYFYQASDGQHVYLHSLNIKMLEVEYGTLDKCPLTIRGKIIEKESGSMTEELRKRLRYLQHLPLTCQFEVTEVNLSSFVSYDVFQSFRDQIEARVRRRQRRAREERRREKKINDEENLKWGRHPTPKLRIESHRQFPLCGTATDDLGFIISSSPTGSSVVSRSQSLSSLSSVSTVVDHPVDPFQQEQNIASSLDYSGPSFAQMLREGNNKSTKKSSWGKSLSVSDSTATPAVHNVSDNEPDVDGYVPVPLFKHSFSEAIAVALEKAESAQEEINLSKKKKKRQKILFVTGMACSRK